VTSDGRWLLRIRPDAPRVRLIKNWITKMAWDMTRDAEVFSTATVDDAAPEERLFAGNLEEAVIYIRNTRPSDQALLAIRLVPDDDNEGPILGARIPEFFPRQD